MRNKANFSQEQYNLLLSCSKKGDFSDWDKWRKSNPDIKILLSYAPLDNLELNGVNLNNANLQGASLSAAKLSESQLIDADLCYSNLNLAYLPHANLKNANLNRASLMDTVLQGANLYKANLHAVDLSGADLNWANLNSANLERADLERVLLQGAHLEDTDLTYANIEDSDLVDARLIGANLEGANLQNADLESADLRFATLKYTNLQNARLIDTLLTETDLSNANLTGIVLKRTTTFGWNVENVICEYIYLDEERNKRKPSDRYFYKGEFEALYRSLPTIEYIFENGMKWYDSLVMNKIASDLYPKYGTQLITLENRGFRPVALFYVKSSDKSDEAQKEIKHQYEEKIEHLEERIDKMIELLYYEKTQPRQLTVGGNYYNAQGDINIQNTIYINAVEEIKEIVEKEDESTFKGKSKKKILEILDDTMKDISTNALKEAGKKIINLAKSDLAPILYKMAGQFAVLHGLNQVFF